ncbi:MAG: hypothetical protein II163_00685, partial [Ruminococcus sp.]|nr:hypothetical protein [Ruminococcus sp.]
MTKIIKKSVSILLAVVMVASLFTIIPFSASAGGNDDLVDQLATLYDGDESRARTDLSLLYDAGVIDEDGNMVSLDIRENGESVELNDLVERIAGDKTVGALTVNGNKATTEQITKIQKVKAALEIVKALDKDTEITDEHVENLQKLLEGVVDGSIDIEKAIDSGTLRLTSGLNDDASDELDEDGFPTTKTDTGEVEAEEGKYTQPLINGSTYKESYDFTLPNAKNTTYYTDSRYEGMGATEGVVTMSRSGTTVTATLNKALTVPVSFEWKAVSGGAEATGSGTVTIPAGQTQGSFTFEQSGSGWSGNCVYYVEAGNLKNAVFSDGKTVWSEEVTYSRSDSIQYARADDMIDPRSTQNNPYRTVVSTNNSGTWVYGIPSYDIFPDIWVGSFKLVVRTDRAVTGDVTVRLISNRGIFRGDVNASNISYKTLQNASYWSEYFGIYSSQVSLIQDTSSTTPRYYFDISRSAVGLGHLEWADWKGYGFYNNPPGYIFRLPQDYNAQIIGIGVEKEAPLTDVQATVSVPQGTYYSGQKVPVTATFNEYMQNSGSLTMKINGEDCPLAAGSSGISKKMTFVYTVKDVDTGSISVSGLSEGFKNGKGSAATVSLTEKSFGAAQGVKIVSDVKRSALDLDNIKYGIDDNDSGDQLVTVLIPFKSGASLNWVGSETVAVNSGNGFTTSLPGYPSTLIRDYVAGMYFSLDGGKTRYPAYVVRSTDGEEKPLALAAKFNAPANPTVYLRKDTLEMFVDGNIVTDPATYMCAWDDMKTDGKGYAYSTSTANSAGCFTEWSYYVKGGVFFTEDGYVSRGEADYSSAVANGFLKLNDGYYVQLADHSDHPERRYDVEILVSEGFYDAVCGAHSEEELKPMKLEYQISDRKNFTFTDAKDFRWISDNEEVATITEEVKNGKTVATVALTGKTGTAGITLKVDNGGVSYELFAGSVILLDGLTPFFNIPTFSKNRTTLTGTDTNILFSTNLTARNAEFGAGETKFSAELYDSSNTKIWSDEYTSTVAQTVTHITIPGDELMNPGTYTVKIFGEYKGTEANIPASWSDTATLTVKRAPV